MCDAGRVEKVYLRNDYCTNRCEARIAVLLRTRDICLAFVVGRGCGPGAPARATLIACVQRRWSQAVRASLLLGGVRDFREQLLGEGPRAPVRVPARPSWEGVEFRGHGGHESAAAAFNAQSSACVSVRDLFPCRSAPRPGFCATSMSCACSGGACIHRHAAARPRRRGRTASCNPIARSSAIRLFSSGFPLDDSVR